LEEATDSINAITAIRECAGDRTFYRPEHSFLGIVQMTQIFTSERLAPEGISVLVDHLPDYVRSALEERSIELGCPIEGVIEMAIASFLDEEAFSFEDCLLARRLDKSSPVT
jgi:hypothetical protein